MEHFVVSIEKIYITEKCLTRDMVKITKPNWVESFTNRKVSLGISK